MTLEKAYFSCVGALVWVNWGFPLSLEKAEQLSCWKSSAAQFYFALPLLSVTSKMNSSWGFAWKLISNFFCSCNLPLAQDQNPWATLVPAARYCPLQFNSRGCCGPVVAQASARKGKKKKKKVIKEPLLVQPAWKKASNHLVPLLLWTLSVDCGVTSCFPKCKQGIKRWGMAFWKGFVVCIFERFNPSLVK